MGGIKYFLNIIVLIILTGSFVYAQDSTKAVKSPKTHKINFVDKNGDGYNDNAPDHDGDGIPNGLDPDWLKMKQNKKRPFRDLNGDGINDWLQNRGKGIKNFQPGKHPKIRDKNPNRHRPPFRPKMKGRK